MTLRKAVLWGGIIVLAVAAGLTWAGRRQMLWGKQIRNLELFKSYDRALDDYHESHGQYPEDLGDIVGDVPWPGVSPGHDIWGHELAYIGEEHRYLLVSHGKDGRPEFEDYSVFLRAAPPTARDICLEWDADQVRSNDGWHQVCGK